MALERNKLAAVVEDFAVTYRTGAVDHLQDRLAPDVIWHGVDPDLTCHNRDEVMQVFRSQARESFRLDQIEVIDAGVKVVLCLRSTDVSDPDRTAHIFQVFTFAGDRIVRMQDFHSRQDALRAAGVSDLATWS
jgi:hypothetical protein